MAQLEWTAYNAPDTAVAGASMNNLGNTGIVVGAAIDNSAGLWTDADFWLALSSAVTTGSGTPNISVWLIPSLDGTNYPNTNPTSANLNVGMILPPASTSCQYFALRGIVLPPAKFVIQMQQQLGVNFPATSTSVCSLYRYRLQSV